MKSAVCLYFAGSLCTNEDKLKRKHKVIDYSDAAPLKTFYYLCVLVGAVWSAVAGQACMRIINSISRGPRLVIRLSPHTLPTPPPLFPHPVSSNANWPVCVCRQTHSSQRPAAHPAAHSRPPGLPCHNHSNTGLVAPWCPCCSGSFFNFF